jgi:hypothetical protein
MSQVIAYQTSEGVSIVVPTGEVSLDVVLSKDVPAGVNYKIIDHSELPSDRAFRSAWFFNDGVQIHMETAKEVHKQNIRIARSPLFEDLDIQFQRALETNSDTSAIVAQKVALRDATIDPAIAAATTPEELKASWNEALLGPSPY